MRAYLSRTVVGLGESFTLTIEVSGEEGEPQLPELQDFQIVSTSSSTQVSIINGQMTSTVSYRYVLVPLRTGRVTIPPIKVQTPSGVKMTPPLNIEVKKTTARQRAGGQRPVFLEAEVTPREGYINQVFTYVLKLYTRVGLRNAGLSGIDIQNFVPDPAVKDGPVQKRGFEYIQGQRYDVIKIIYPMYPLRTGEFKIQGARVTVEVPRPRGRRDQTNPLWDFFEEDFFSGRRYQRRVLVAEPIKVRVKSLPPPPPGTLFTGLIGRFEGRWKLSASKINADETLTLTLEITGTGNLRNVRFPEGLTFPGFRFFPDEPQVEVQVAEEGLKGRALLRAALMPEKPGTYELNSGGQTLVYFDPAEGVYRAFPPLRYRVDVKPSLKASSRITAAMTKRPAEEVKNLAEDIFDVYTGEAALRRQRLFPHPAILYTVLVFPVLLGIFAVGYVWLGHRERLFAKERSAHRAFSELKQGVKRAGNAESLLKAFLNYASAKTGGERSFTPEEAVALMARFLPEEEVQRLKGLVSQLESAIYGYSGELNIQKVSQELLSILKNVERKARGLVSSAFVPLLFLVLVNIPGSSQQVFQHAVKVYSEGRYEEARQAFLRLYQQGLRNGYILYNAGNAAYRSGHVGEAVLHYRAALFYLPFYGDLKWNLAMARKQRKDRFQTPSSRRLVHILSSPFSWPVKYAVVLFLIFHGLFWMALSFFILKRRFRAFCAVLACVYLYAGVCVFLALKGLYFEKDAVVVVPEVKVFSGTDVKSAVLFRIHEGTEVKVKRVRGDWFAVELPDGRMGWIKSDAVGIVQEEVLGRDSGV